MINEKHGNRAEVCNIATRAQILKGKDGKLCWKASSIATLTDCRLEDTAGAQISTRIYVSSGGFCEAISLVDEKNNNKMKK